MADSNSEPASPIAKPTGPPTLLTLPAEIRIYIYDLAIFNSPLIGAPRPVQLITVGHHDRSAFPDYPPTFISTVSLTKDVRFVISEQGFEYPEAESPFNTPHNLFSTCRQIRRETQKSYYSCNTFIVRMTPKGASTFVDWLDAIGQDARGFLRTLLIVFMFPGDASRMNTKIYSEISLLDINIKDQPRVIVPAPLRHAAEHGDHQSNSPEAFEAAFLSLPVFKFLMDDPCYKVPWAAVIRSRVNGLGESLEEQLYELWLPWARNHIEEIYFKTEGDELMQFALRRPADPALPVRVEEKA
ncbi:hypothetical protein Vi05172_g9884 [Venturia inaequalis]|nr:hypothetical protein Vi05172_g9884 [Venturia inaequalis]